MPPFGLPESAPVIITAPDEAALNQMFIEYPFSPFSDIEHRPILGGALPPGRARSSSSPSRPPSPPSAPKPRVSGWPAAMAGQHLFA